MTFDALKSPHWQGTRRAAEACDVVLLIQDTSELDFTGQASTPIAKMLSPITRNQRSVSMGGA